MSVCRVDMPGPEAIEGILDRMRVDLAFELGFDPQRLPTIEPQARRALAEAFGRGRSLRTIKAALVRALAASVRHKNQPT